MSAHYTALEGNRQRLDGGAMFGNAPRPVWERWITPDHLGRIELACRGLLIELNGKKILCETGIGSFFDPKLADRFGIRDYGRHVLLDSLAALGISDSDIDFVILSHLHFDHAGGLLPTYGEIAAGRDGILFPRARYVVGEVAFDRAINPHSRDRASFVPGLAEKLQRTGRLTVIPKGHAKLDALPEFQFLYSDGHTPGQLHALASGSDHQILFCGDLIPGIPWLHIPITMGYDRFPERLVDEKSEILSAADRESWLLFYTHDPRIAVSRCKRQPDGRVVSIEPVENPKRIPF